MEQVTKSYLKEILAVVGKERLLTNETQIHTALIDHSWLSPVLSSYIQVLKANTGKALDVDAVVIPESVDALKAVIGIAVRHDVPITVRGGGTSGFGQTIPLKGGIVIDIRLLTGILEIADSTITVRAGTLQGDVDLEARKHGMELPILTTTFATATAAGWIAGGHVGLGATTYGTIWDGNVLAVKLLTAEDPPREIALRGEEVIPVLHTYGTTGVITEVTFRIVPARRWVELIGVFDTFEEAVSFTADISQRTDIVQRVVTAQDSEVSKSFVPLAQQFEPGQSLALIIVDGEFEAECTALCETYGGTSRVWKRHNEDDRRISLGLMVYGHRMLWIKKLAGDSAFLHIYFSPDHYRNQIDALRQEFGSRLWLEFKYIRSGWLRALHGLPVEGTLPAALLTLVPGDEASLRHLMAYCSQIQVWYQNPHTFLLEQSGLFPDFSQIIAFKRKVDPKFLLNPGKIGEQILHEA